MDCQGICVVAVRILHSACPGCVIAVINRLALYGREVVAIIVEGKTKGKLKGACQPRIILF